MSFCLNSWTKMAYILSIFDCNVSKFLSASSVNLICEALKKGTNHNICIIKIHHKKKVFTIHGILWTHDVTEPLSGLIAHLFDRALQRYLRCHGSERLFTGMPEVNLGINFTSAWVAYITVMVIHDMTFLNAGTYKAIYNIYTYYLITGQR